MALTFNATTEEMNTIVKIAERYAKHCTDSGREPYGDRTKVIMDLENCHCNGTPLDLERLLTGLDYLHDINGIANNIDRVNGGLTGCFLPRYAKQETPKKPEEKYVSEDIIEKLRDAAADCDGRLSLDYSGRGMYGETCVAIECDSSTAAIEAAAERGIKGGRIDQLGMGYIVYWPQHKTKAGDAD